MVNVYLSAQDYKTAMVDLWQNGHNQTLDYLERNAPTTPPAPAPPPPAPPAAPPQTPAASVEATPPPPTSPAATPAAPAVPAAPAYQPDHDAITSWQNKTIADAWEKSITDQLDKGMGPVVDAINQTLASVPQQAQGWARGVLHLPTDQAATAGTQPAPGAISGTFGSPGAFDFGGLGQTPERHSVPSFAPAAPTTAELSGAPTGSGQVGGTQQQLLNTAGDLARQRYGDDGARALQAVLVTEGGLGGARGDSGQSAGPLQFYEGGQLANYAQQHSLTLEQAKADVEARPLHAIDWALGTPDQPGYLGAVIQRGQQQGLAGADLATYAQQHGQVSVSPERAGANYNALFGAGGGAAGQQAASVGQPIALNRTSQFQLGLSDADAAAACGPAAAIAFARAFGRNPTAQEAMQLAQQSGWTQAGGMNGIVNEKKLLDAMQIPDKLETGQVNWSKVTSEVTNGNPVIVSTPGHYFTVDNAQQQPDGSTLYHVGTSGTDLRQGAEWMSAADMQRLMGSANGALFADHPQASGPSFTESASTAARNVSTAVQVKAQDLVNAVTQIGQNATDALGATAARVQSPNTGNPLANAVGTAASALGTGVQSALSPFGGASEQFPTGGPLAGPGVGLGRSVAGFEHLRQENPEYGALANERDHIIAQLPPNATAIAMQGGPEADRIRALQDRYEQIRQRMSEIASQSDIFAAAQRNPNIASYEQQGGLMQAAAAAPLVAGEAPLASRAVASVIDPQTGLPSLAGRALEAVRGIGGPVTEAVGHLMTPVDSAVADASGRVVGGAQAAQISPQFAATLGGAAAGGSTAYATTDENDPNRWLKVGAGALAGAAGTGFAIGAARGAMGAQAPALTNVNPVTPLDVFRQYHSGNVISGLGTLTHVMVNSILAPAWSFASRGAADIAGGVTGLATGGRLGLDTGFSRVQGSGVGIAAGLASAGEDFGRALAQHYIDPNTVANRLGGVGGALLNAQSTFAALHGAFQTAAQGIIARTELGRLAGEAATQQGLQGRAWINAVSNMINTPAAGMLQEAEGVAQRAVLRGDLGTLGTQMQNIAGVPFVGNTLFPVVRIAANALSQGIEKSPIGLAGTAFDVARAAVHQGPYAGGFSSVGGAVTPLAERLTNNIAGTALTAWLLQKSMDGTITGNGPSDPKVRAMLQSQGWQPNSVYVPGRGYMDYHALGPLAIPLNIAGNFHDAVAYAKTGADAEQIAGDLADRVGGYLADATGLRTLGELYNVLHGGASVGSAAAQFGGSLIGGFVPESAALRSGVTAFDPNMRQVQPGNMQQVIQMGLPGGTPLIGGRQDLPVKLDVLGRPETNPQQGLGTFLPRTGTGQPDPTLTLLANAGIDLAANSPKTLNYAGKQLQLSAAEQQLRQEAFGQRLQQVLQSYVNSTRFQALPPAQQYKALEPLVRSAGSYADQRVLASIPAPDRQARAAAAPRAYGAGVVPYLGPAATTMARMVANQANQAADARHAALMEQLRQPLAPAAAP